MPFYQIVSFKLNLPLSDAFDIYMHFALFKYSISSDNSRPSINRLPQITEKSVEKKVIKGEAESRKNTKFLVNKTSFGSWQQ